MEVKFVPLSMADGDTIGPFVVERFHMHGDVMLAWTARGGTLQMRLPSHQSKYALMCEPCDEFGKPLP